MGRCYPAATSEVTPFHFLFPVTLIPLGTLPLPVRAGSVRPTPIKTQGSWGSLLPLVNQSAVAPPTCSPHCVPSDPASSSGAADWSQVSGGACGELKVKCVESLSVSTSRRLRPRIQQKERNPRKGKRKNLPEANAAAGRTLGGVCASLPMPCWKCLL